MTGSHRENAGVRVAAVADVHMHSGILGRFRTELDLLGGRADMLLIAGDLTRHGTLDEAQCVVAEFGGLPVPVIVVLGNHDYHSDQSRQIINLLTDNGIQVLDGTATIVGIDGVRVGIAGLSGFGGGFAGASASEFGEPEMKAFAAHGREQANNLRLAFETIDADIRIALTHYAPVRETLLGEPVELYPFLGSHLLGAVADEAGVSLAIHGHAHAGSPEGRTPGGVPVRNVAYPVLRKPYAVFTVSAAGTGSAAAVPRT